MSDFENWFREYTRCHPPPNSSFRAKSAIEAAWDYQQDIIIKKQREWVKHHQSNAEIRLNESTVAKKQIESLKQKNELLRDGLKFYSRNERGNWEIGKITNDCGKLAEETLKKVDELNKEQR